MTSEVTSQEEVSTIQWISSVEAKIEDTKVKREKKLTSGKLEELRKEKINFFRINIKFMSKELIFLTQLLHFSNLIRNIKSVLDCFRTF